MDEREVQRMNARKKYRILVSALLVLSVMLTAGAGMAALKRQIPDHMTVRERGEAPVFFFRADWKLDRDKGGGKHGIF